MTQEALKLALDALETELSIDWTNNDEFNASAEKMYEAIAAIKEALAQPEQEPIYQYQMANGSWIDQTKESHDYNVRHGQATVRVVHTTPPQLKQEQEPVATVTSETGADITMSWWHEPALPIGTKLYTHPPQRTWVGLTEEEAMDVTRKEGHELLDFIYEYGTGSEGVEERIVAICKAIEAKLKELNT
jgi:hypothetical protein